MRIVLIEDDVKLCEVLLPSLEEAGFKADCCHSGAEGLELLRRGYYDACILDRMLPELNGLTLLKVIRSEGSHVPVLMLTALDQIGDRVTGLDAGADDYLTKPFDTRELLARLRAICRRPGQIEKVESIACGDIVLDTEQHTLTGPKGRADISPRECELLSVLCKSSGTLRSRAVLLGNVWGSEAEVEEASLDSYIHFVRRRLAAVGSSVRIVTIRGSGYRLEEKPNA